MMKFILGIVLVGIASAAMGQELVKEFFDKNDQACEEAESYYYKMGRKVLFLNHAKSMDTIESYVDTVYSFYTKNNVLKSKEVYSQEGFREGGAYNFHENGSVKDKEIFRKDRLVGKFISWYPDGKLHKVLEYPDEKGMVSSWAAIDFKIISYWDSTGRQSVTKGNGLCDCYLVEEGRRFIRETGKVKAGFRDSVWIGSDGSEVLFKEVYEDAQLKKGIRYLNSKEFEYEFFEVVPEYTGGYSAMAQHLYRNLQYPTPAKRKGIQGSVFVSFVVGVDGRLSDVKTLKGVDSDLDHEAIRVVKLMPKWNPGLQRGRPVKTRFVLPIKFKLSG